MGPKIRMLVQQDDDNDHEYIYDDIPDAEQFRALIKSHVSRGAMVMIWIDCQESE